MAYFALGKDDPVGDAGEVLAGFEATFPLTDVERRLVPALVAARLVCSCACGAYSAAMDPDNAEYLLLTQRPGWAALRAFRDGGRRVFGAVGGAGGAERGDGAVGEDVGAIAARGRTWTGEGERGKDWRFHARAISTD